MEQNEEHIIVEKIMSVWIEKKRFRYCPVCMVGQEKTQMEATPFCPVCGTRLTDETPIRWKEINCTYIKEESNGTDTQE